jgi:hypothetical protein
MHSLRELQRDLARAFLTGDLAGAAPWVRATEIPASRRLQIYRNNATAGFHGALAAGFPVLLRLMGDAYFRQLALEYQAAHPSPSGNLHHVGSRLREFLQRRFAGTEYDYFSHVAALEWHCQEVMIAADRAPLDLPRLATVPPADYARLRFGLNPAVRLMRSPYPIFRIWAANRAGGEPEVIDLAAGGEDVLVCREGEGVMLYRLPPAEFECLAALSAARPLGQALELATATDPDFDLPGALMRWAALAVLVDFSIPFESGDA